VEENRNELKEKRSERWSWLLVEEDEEQGVVDVSGFAETEERDRDRERNEREM